MRFRISDIRQHPSIHSYAHGCIAHWCAYFRQGPNRLQKQCCDCREINCLISQSPELKFEINHFSSPYNPTPPSQTSEFRRGSRYFASHILFHTQQLLHNINANYSIIMTIPSPKPHSNHGTCHYH